MKLKLRGLKLSLSKRDWQPLVLFGLLLLGVGALLWWQLGTLTAGYSANELKAYQSSLSLKYIFDHPLNAPFHLLGTAIWRITGDGLLAMRFTSAIIGLATFGVFYWLVKSWHGHRSALLGSLLFGSSAWFLHTARLGTPDILMFSLLALVAGAVWVKHSKRSLPLLVVFALATALMYVPGMIWFIVLGLVWQWKRVDRLLKQNLVAVGIGAVLIIAALAPLGWAIYQDPNLAKQLVGLPASGWPDPLAALRTFAEVPLAVAWRTPVDPEHWLGQLPILDAFTLAMFGLGMYLFAKHWRLSRAAWLVVILVLSTALISLKGGVSISIIVPFLYIVAAAGAGFMLDYWYRVFPRNVFAQATGTLLITCAVASVMAYNLRHYYAAWPGAPATQTIFTVHSNQSDRIKE